MNTAILFVDYDGLLVDLSYINNLNIHVLLLERLRTAQQNYSLVKAYLLADPVRVRQLDVLEAAGYVCHSTQSNTQTAIKWQLQQIITTLLKEEQGIDTFIFCGGVLDYVPILTEISMAKKQSDLWTVIPPKQEILSRVTRYKQISIEVSGNENQWSRHTMLSAIVLITGYSYIDDLELIHANEISTRLDALSTHRGFATEWIIVAIREEILHFELDGDNLMLRLNRIHPYVQTCKNHLNRTIALVDVMMDAKDWVAFSALTKTLRTGARGMSRRQCQEWLELLIEINVLKMEKLIHDSSPFPTTAVYLNPEHAAVMDHEDLFYFKLVQLIVVIDNFLVRNHYRWIAVSSLLKRLTVLTSRLEARAILASAEEQAIVQFSSTPSTRNPSHYVTTLLLNDVHPLVQEAVSMRDRIIEAIYDDTSEHYLGTIPEVVIGNLAQKFQMSSTIARAWFQLLKQENLLYPTDILSTDDQLCAYVVTPDDAVVHAALS